MIGCATCNERDGLINYKQYTVIFIYNMQLTSFGFEGAR